MGWLPGQDDPYQSKNPQVVAAQKAKDAQRAQDENLTVKYDASGHPYGWNNVASQPEAPPPPTYGHSQASPEELAAMMAARNKPAGGGGAAPAAAAPAPMAGLKAALGGSGGDGGSGGMVNIPPPAKPDSVPVSMGGGSETSGGINVGESIQGLRQGLGTRTPPTMMSALAQLGRIY